MPPTLPKEGGREGSREGGRDRRPCCTCPGKTGTRVAAQHQFLNTLSKQEKGRHRVSVALKTEIRAMRLLVLASDVLLICP